MDPESGDFASFRGNSAMKHRLWLAILAWGLVSGCVYFNTFFLANKAYNEAEKRMVQTPDFV